MLAAVLSPLFCLGLQPGFGAEPSCEEFRLDQPPHVMAGVVPKDQVDTSACAAYATVEMLDAWYRTHGGPTGFSPIELDLRFRESARDFDAGTDPCTLLESEIREGGLCPMSELDHHPPDDLKRDFELLSRKAGRTTRKYAFSSIFISNPTRLHQRAVRLAGRLTDSSDFRSCPDTEESSRQNDELVARGIETSLSAVSLLRWSLYPSCAETGQRSFPPHMPRCHYLWKDPSGSLLTPKAFKAGLQTALRDQKQPIDVGFCANLFTEPAFVGVDAGVVTSQCKRHHAIAIGQRRNPKSGRCEILIQNSYGANPQSADPGKDWVDAEALSRNTFVLEWLGR